MMVYQAMSHVKLPRMRELPRSYIICQKYTEVTF
jgi:hypothetical protein